MNYFADEAVEAQGGIVLLRVALAERWSQADVAAQLGPLDPHPSGCPVHVRLNCPIALNNTQKKIPTAGHGPGNSRVLP